VPDTPAGVWGRVVHMRTYAVRLSDGSYGPQLDGLISSPADLKAPSGVNIAPRRAFWGTYSIVTVGSAMGLGLKPFHAQ
jgi:hypothetical protein